ncbi:Cys-tRNA(Pro) deacylase [Desulfatibacillum aliphaticivorans]|uniref:Cys-tRNA(Pro) deacylase n=1 Tax=Desulfatibacillum aliphaticivorans TaxID=218208 RepID=UPI0004269BE3|nr:Cys-tRNA(Pro) deacylase [Desulfatibacillum aliphaticivorans]
MAKHKAPMTQAIRELKSHKAEFELHPYKYEDKGGAAGAAHALGLDEYQVVKTLVMEDENKQALLVLMHGDKEVSTKALARAIGVKAVQPCDPKKANALTGYMVGGISPFGTKKRLPVYAEASIMDLKPIYINAGKRGLLASISPKALDEILKPALVNVAL